MTRKTLAILAILAMLLITMFGTVAAQEGTDPVETPEPETPVVITHPIVKLLGEYFGRDTGDTTEPDPVEPPVVDPVDPADPADPTDPTEPVEPPVTPETVAAEIAAYHEEGIGFGVLVKLYAIAEESREACEAEGDAGTPAEGEGEAEVCTPLLVDDLVTELKSGAGMGSLFKEYGKPALLGVGHVKKALKEHDKSLEEQEEGETTDDTLLEKGKKDKGSKAPKENKGKKDK